MLGRFFHAAGRGGETGRPGDNSAHRCAGGGEERRPRGGESSSATLAMHAHARRCCLFSDALAAVGTAVVRLQTAHTPAPRRFTSVGCSLFALSPVVV